MKTSIFVSFFLLAAIVILCTFTQTGRSTAYGCWAMLEGLVKGNTVLIRAEGKIAAAKASRERLEATADRFAVESRVADRKAKRLEDEAAKTKNAFEILNSDAKKAGLPKFAESSEEQRNAEYRIAGRRMSGDDAYRYLRKYKSDLFRANAAINRETEKSAFYKQWAEQIRDRIPPISDKIVELEQLVADYRVSVELRRCNAEAEAIGVAVSVIDEDGIRETLTTEVEKIDVELQLSAEKGEAESIKRDISDKAAPFAVTDDDLI